MYKITISDAELGMKEEQLYKLSDEERMALNEGSNEVIRRIVEKRKAEWN